MTGRRVMRMLVAAMAAAAAIGPAAPAQAVPGPAPWVARHDLSSGAYQAAFNTFTGQGFRLTAVSGYVKNGAIRYAALWRKVDGPPWLARHGMSPGAYQKAFDANAKAGYRLVYVNAFEVGNTARFAAIWEKRSGPAYIARHGLTGSAYQSTFNSLTKKGFRLLHVSGYSRNGAARYAAIFEQSAGPAWVARHGLSGGGYQAAFDAFGKQGFRLKLVSGYNIAGKDRYAAIWEKVPGPVMRARHGIHGSSYQRYFDIDRFQGYTPIYVQGFTSDSSTRFNTIWESPFKAEDLAKLQAAGNDFLKTAPAPQQGLSVAIAKQGRLVWASGYGLADRAKKTPLDVNHLLRIGSISKTVTAVALYRMKQEGRLTPPALGKTGMDRRVFGPGGILSAEVTLPASMKDLEGATVRQFLEHTSGLPGAGPRNSDPDGSGPAQRPFLAPGDPVDCGPSGNRSLPDRIEVELARHAQASANAGKAPLNGKPGDWDDYSNFSHNIAEAVIEKIARTSYSNYVRARVFNPSGITRARLFRIGPYDPASGEAQHYGSNGNYAEYREADTCEKEPPGTGAGGWAMSAKDLLRYFVSVDGLPAREILSPTNFNESVTPGTPAMAPSTYARSWITQGWGWCGTGPVAITHGHNGGLNGAYSNMFQLTNGYSFAIIGNQSVAGGGPCIDGVKPFYDLLTTIDWPEYDLF